MLLLIWIPVVNRKYFIGEESAQTNIVFLLKIRDPLVNFFLRVVIN